jgi:glycosyltransferase involved in cell wall biosynthesis
MVREFHCGGSTAKRAGHLRKRICLVTSESLSTNPRVVKEADALAHAGHQVRVVSCQWLDWTRREDAKLLATRGWTSQIVDYSPKRSAELFWASRIRYHAFRLLAPRLQGDAILQRAIGRVGPELVRLAVSKPADLFIGHNIAALPAVVLAAQRQRVPAAFDVEDLHSSMWLKEKGPAAPDLLAASVEKRFLAQCAYVTAAAPLIAHAYASRYGISLPETLLNVFPRSLRPAQWRPGDVTRPLTLYWFSQTIGARRGLEDIIRAIGLSRCAGIQLHLRGQWQIGYRETLYRVLEESSLRPEQLIWHDVAAPDDMVRLAAEYDVGLALEPGCSENNSIALSNKMFTYLLAGNAVVATATLGQRQLMQQIRGAGLCYELGDVQTLARQLRQWESDRASLERARLLAWRFGEEQFNWDLEQRKFLKLVERALTASDIETDNQQ